MTDITPPPELVQQWEEDWHHSKVKHIEFEPYIAAQAAQWGADTELEAIQKEIITQAWFADPRHRLAQLRAARRPKPPSLKELALEALDQADKGLNKSEWQQCSDTIRRALEELP
jgi:hypothetical protein